MLEVLVLALAQKSKKLNQLYGVSRHSASICRT